MTIERTFSMIKPDATERNLVGAITAMIESSGLKVIASRRTKMTPEKAAEFAQTFSSHAAVFSNVCADKNVHGVMISTSFPCPLSI